MSEPVERLEVDVDATTAAYLALRDAATSLARYHESREAELLASLEDTDAALAELH